jgi:hypothetical protein
MLIQVCSEYLFDASESADQHAEVCREPLSILGLKRSVFETNQCAGIPFDPEVPDKAIGLIIHTLAQVFHLTENRASPTPGEEGSVQANHLLIARIVEAVRYGNRIDLDIGAVFKTLHESIQKTRQR